LLQGTKTGLCGGQISRLKILAKFLKLLLGFLNLVLQGCIGQIEEVTAGNTCY
jgi:hypothetical protein